MEYLLVEHDGMVAHITLNRPDKHNAMNEQMIAELTDTFTLLEQNPNVRVIVLSSTGKHFCAGADLGWMKKMARYSVDENLKDARALAQLFRVMHELSKPILTIVQGGAYGGALGLLCCSDVVIAAEQSSFCFSEVKLGIIPATISPYVVQKIGISQARRYFISAEVFNAHRAQNIDLVHRLCPLDQLEQHADEVITSLLQNGPHAMAATKQLLRDLAPITDQLVNHTSELIANIRVSDEGQAGLHAFLEKQQPNWISA